MRREDRLDLLFDGQTAGFGIGDLLRTDGGHNQQQRCGPAQGPSQLSMVTDMPHARLLSLQPAKPHATARR